MSIFSFGRHTPFNYGMQISLFRILCFQIGVCVVVKASQIFSIHLSHHVEFCVLSFLVFLLVYVYNLRHYFVHQAFFVSLRTSQNYVIINITLL